MGDFRSVSIINRNDTKQTVRFYTPEHLDMDVPALKKEVYNHFNSFDDHNISELMVIAVSQDTNRCITEVTCHVAWCTDNSSDRYPHKCPHCKWPAYIGGDGTVDCSRCDGTMK